MESSKLPGLFINVMTYQGVGGYREVEAISRRHRPGTRYNTLPLREYPIVYAGGFDIEILPPGPIRQWLDERGIPYGERRYRNVFGETYIDGWRANLTPDQWFEFKLHFG